MTHARPFWTSTLQDLSNGIMNISMQGVLAPKIEFWAFGSPGRLLSPVFGSVNGNLALPSKWGCKIQEYEWRPHTSLKVRLRHISCYSSFSYIDLDTITSCDCPSTKGCYNSSSSYEIMITCGASFVVEVVVLLKKFSVAYNSSSNSLLFCSCSKTLVSLAIGVCESNGFT